MRQPMRSQPRPGRSGTPWASRRSWRSPHPAVPLYSIARERPEAPIIGLTPDLQTARRLAVTWGVHAIVAPDAHSMSEAVTRALRAAQIEGFAQKGDEIVVAAGIPFGHSGSTNTLQVAKA